MKLSTPFAVVVLSSLVSAWPALENHVKGRELKERADLNPWIPASQVPNSVRSPCPGTNTLANHGYINRNGRNITAKAYQYGFLRAFGMDLTVTANGAANAVNLCTRLTGKTCTAFNLDQLSHPHIIEHDASLTRNDYNMSWSPHVPWDNHDFNSSVFFLTRASYGFGATHINMQAANRARLHRQSEAAKQDTPGWFIANNAGSGVEAAFYLAVANDPALHQPYQTNPQARLDWIRYWFANERLPTALGWVKPSPPMTCMQCLASKIKAQPTAGPTNKARSIEDMKREGTYVERRGKDSRDPRVASAAAKATQVVGPPPAIPDFYTEEVSPESIEAVEASLESYVQQVEAAYEAALGGGGL